MQSVVDEINEDGGIGGRQIELRIMLVDGTAGPEVGQAACLEMTQDFGAFAVILAPAMSRDVARCTSVTNETLTINSTGFDEALYEEAEGRLFSTGSDTSMSTDRQYEGWARLLDDEGVLEGKTIGVVTAEQSPEFAAAVEAGSCPRWRSSATRWPSNVTLPCPEGDPDCDQHEAAVQQMKDAGVDFVFMAAANLAGPAVVQAAENLDFHPQWAANGNQVTDTVSQFFESVKDEWDGAIGTSTVFAQVDDLTDEAHECNEIVTERSGEEYEPGSDAFGFAVGDCIPMQMLQRAADEIEPADLEPGRGDRGHRGPRRGRAQRRARPARCPPTSTTPATTCSWPTTTRPTRSSSSARTSLSRSTAERCLRRRVARSGRRSRLPVIERGGPPGAGAGRRDGGRPARRPAARRRRRADVAGRTPSGPAAPPRSSPSASPAWSTGSTTAPCRCSPPTSRPAWAVATR